MTVSSMHYTNIYEDHQRFILSIEVRNLPHLDTAEISENSTLYIIPSTIMVSKNTHYHVYFTQKI